MLDNPIIHNNEEYNVLTISEDNITKKKNNMNKNKGNYNMKKTRKITYHLTPE